MTAKSKSQDDLLKMGSARNRKRTSVESFGLSTSSPLARTRVDGLSLRAHLPDQLISHPHGRGRGAWIFMNRSIVERSYQFIFLLKISVTFKRSIRRLSHQLTPSTRSILDHPFLGYTMFLYYIYMLTYIRLGILRVNKRPALSSRWLQNRSDLQRCRTHITTR